MSQEIEILPVFISSTWKDLRPEHEAAERAVNSMRETKYEGMKYFGARDEDTRRASLDEVDRSRVYVGIIGGRYGSGITEAEYDRATTRGLRRFIYFKSDASTPADAPETDPAQLAKLAAFKQKLRAAHTVKEFDTPDDLRAQVTEALHRWLFDEYITPKLQGALDGEVPRDEAKALLDAVKDLKSLRHDLLDSLRGAGITVIPTLHQLRAAVGDFVGREKEIDELLSTLRRGGSAAIAGISGMGGVGKTELSLYVANRLRDAYPDAQLVLDMRGTDERPRDPSDALAACIRAFHGPETPLPDDLEELKRLYLSTLEGRRALILLDNARDSAQVRPLMPPEGSALLITSRNVVTLPHMTRVTLDQLSHAEARELLTGIAPRVPADVADRICFLCGYLPLAIRAAGSLLDVTADLAPEVYAEQLQDERRRLELIGTEGVDLDMGASFGLSYDRLAPDAARVFRRLAVFPITFDARAEEAICEDEGHRHLSELLRRNLVRYNEGSRRYGLHDLARLFADSRMSEDEARAARMRHAEHYMMVLAACDRLYMKGGDALKKGLAFFDLERRNFEAGWAWACRHSGGDEEAAGLCNKYPNAGANVLELRLHPRERVSWLEAALAAARQLQDRDAERAHTGNLGLAYNALGETRRAVGFYEQQLSLAREAGERESEGIALGNLGNAYLNLGETRRAVELYEQALTAARETGDRRGESRHLGNLGAAYRILGEAKRAVEFLEQQLVIDRELGNRHGEGFALSNLGAAYLALGELRRAVELMEHALAISRELGDRRGEGSDLNNLGAIYSKLGENRRAAELYEQQLAIAREVGNRHGEGIALFNIGFAFDKLGERAEAVVRLEAALAIFEQVESPHAETARALLARLRGQSRKKETR